MSTTVSSVTTADTASTPNNNMPMSIDYLQLDHTLGHDHTVMWIEGLKSKANRLREGPFKAMLLSVIYNKGLFTPKFKTKSEIAKLFNLTDADQITSVYDKSMAQTSADYMNVIPAQVAVHSAICGLMGPNSSQVLNADPIWRANDLIEAPDIPNPDTSWKAMIRTHVTEREGTSKQQQILQKGEQFRDWLGFHMEKGETWGDYQERDRRAKNHLANLGIPIKMLYKDEEELAIKWIFGLDQERFSPLMRDIANGVIATPKTMMDAVTMVKNRKELPGQTQSSALKAFVVDNNKTKMINGKPEISPMELYGRFSTQDWESMSVEDKAAVLQHNLKLKMAARGNKPFEDKPRAPRNKDSEGRQKDKVNPKKATKVALTLFDGEFSDGEYDDIGTALVVTTAEPNAAFPSVRNCVAWLVIGGRFEGTIFTNYEHCKQAIARRNGERGGICKGFMTYEEAETYRAIHIRSYDEQGDPDFVPLVEPPIHHVPTLVSSPEAFNYQTNINMHPFDSRIQPIRRENLVISPADNHRRIHGTNVVSIGDQLTIANEIAIPGQEIGEFHGEVITAEQAQLDFDIGKGQYMIELPNGDVLNCYESAMAHLCPPSMANCANKCIYDRILDRHLHDDDNNSYVDFLKRNDGSYAVKLFAVQVIQPDVPIMWDYGEAFSFSTRVSEEARSLSDIVDSDTSLSDEDVQSPSAPTTITDLGTFGRSTGATPAEKGPFSKPTTGATGKDTSRVRGEGQVNRGGVSLTRPTTPVRLTPAGGAGLALGGRRDQALTARNRPPIPPPKGDNLPQTCLVADIASPFDAVDEVSSEPTLEEFDTSKIYASVNQQSLVFTSSAEAETVATRTYITKNGVYRRTDMGPRTHDPLAKHKLIGSKTRAYRFLTVPFTIEPLVVLLGVMITAILAFMPAVISTTAVQHRSPAMVLMAQINQGSTFDTTHSYDPFYDHYAIFDPASPMTMCKSAQHAIDRRPCKTGMIGGVVEGTATGSFNEVCTFAHPDLGTVPYVPSSVANIVSQTRHKDQGWTVNHDDVDQSYTMKSPDGRSTLQFGRMTINTWGTLSAYYVMDLRTHRVPKRTPFTLLLLPGKIRTVRSNAAVYTKREVEDAEKAARFLDCMGHPTQAAAITMVKNMKHAPVTTEDIKRAFHIYGESLQSIQGRTTRSKTQPSEVPLRQIVVQEQQKAEVDIMYVHKRPFLTAILSPLEHSFVVPLKKKTAKDILTALEDILNHASSRGFNVQWIRADNEPGLSSHDVAGQLQHKGIEMDIVGSGDHCSRIERRIRFIKDKYRILENGLPYAPNDELIDWGVLAANRFTNLQVSSTSTSPMSPREKFLGRPFDFEKDSGVPFGTYVQATRADSDNSPKPRTEGAIALMPKDNLSGTMYLYKLSSNRVISRNQYKPLPLPDVLVTHMNLMAENDGWKQKILDADYNDTNILDDDAALLQETGPTFQPHAIEQRTVPQLTNQSELQTNSDSNDAAAHEREAQVRAWMAAPYFQPEPTKTSPPAPPAATFADPPTVPTISPVKPKATPTRLASPPETFRRSERLRQVAETKLALLVAIDSIKRWDHKHFVFASTISRAIAKFGEPARDSIEKEVLQFIEKEVFQPVDGVPKEHIDRLIPSHLFLKEKYWPDGSFEKLKSRLVARGDRQDRELYDEDLGAPTAEHSSTMSVAAIAASEKRAVVVLDIGGAYLNASMPSDNPVYMRIEPALADIIVKHHPQYSQFIRKNGELIVKLKKAVYGCIEAAKLWHLHLTRSLASLGYHPNAYDPCVFNKQGSDGLQCTIVLHVDDLLITSASPALIDELVDGLRAEFKETKVVRGPIVPYLGMTLDFSTPGSVSITMDGMVEAILADCNVDDLTKVTRSPAMEGLFECDDDSPLLDTKDKKYFHTFTARLLYLAKRVKPECLVTVAFLATRVTKSTLQDLGKLRRLLRYLHYSHTIEHHRGIRLTPGEHGLNVRAYIDAAYGVHDSGKSHTGSAITLGTSGPIHTDSKKQPIVTKSSTEAELVATSDSVNQAFHVRNFIVSQGHETGPVTLFQDNLSCMALLEKGRSTSTRTKHISIRYFWVKERMANGELQVTHLGTEHMGAANILTKPLQGAQFIKERLQLTNWA